MNQNDAALMAGLMAAAPFAVAALVIAVRCWGRTEPRGEPPRPVPRTPAEETVARACQRAWDASPRFDPMLSESAEHAQKEQP